MCQCGVSSSSSSSSFATCSVLVHTYPTFPGKAKWSRPHQRMWEDNGFKFHSVTCYTKSIVSFVHVNTTKLRNITYTLVATCVILRTLEWNNRSSFTCQRRLMTYLTGYCQHWFPMWKVRTGRLDSEEDVGEAGPSWMKIWPSPGHT